MRHITCNNCFQKLSRVALMKQRSPTLKSELVVLRIISVLHNAVDVSVMRQLREQAVFRLRVG